MMWQWDLSATLGWASGSGPGGSWLNCSTPTPSTTWEVRMGCHMRFYVHCKGAFWKKGTP